MTETMSTTITRTVAHAARVNAADFASLRERNLSRRTIA